MLKEYKGELLFIAISMAVYVFLATIDASQKFAYGGFIFGLFGLVVAWKIFEHVDDQPEGNEKMMEIADSIHEGAMVFLSREYRIRRRRRRSSMAPPAGCRRSRRVPAPAPPAIGRRAGIRPTGRARRAYWPPLSRWQAQAARRTTGEPRTSQLVGLPPSDPGRRLAPLGEGPLLVPTLER